MLTNQQAFDKVVKHLRSMEEQSVGPNDECMYRGLNGAMCAIGCLIPDEHYHANLEGNGIGGSINLFPTLNHLNQEMLSRLQDFHDDPLNWSDDGFHAEFKLENMANDYDLVYSIGEEQ